MNYFYSTQAKFSKFCLSRRHFIRSQVPIPLLNFSFKSLLQFLLHLGVKTAQHRYFFWIWNNKTPLYNFWISLNFTKFDNFKSCKKGLLRCIYIDCKNCIPTYKNKAIKWNGLICGKILNEAFYFPYRSNSKNIVFRTIARFLSLTYNFYRRL